MAVGDVSDSEVLALANVIAKVTSGDLASYPGITAAMLAEFGTDRDEYKVQLQDHYQARDASRAAKKRKDGGKKKLVTSIRRFRELLRANGVDEAKYRALGIPASQSNVPTNATVPIGAVDIRDRLRHKVSFSDASDPGKKRRPRGVRGCELWMKIDGPEPGDEKDRVFITLALKTPFVVQHEPQNAGKIAHYMLRWLFADGSKSAWSETVSATIPA